MVEMNYPASADRGAFDDFYDKHIAMLLTIDGFKSAQRFECVHAAAAPFLAVYRLREAAVMASEHYTAKAGRQSVDPVFRAQMTNWDRNLLECRLADLEVQDGGWLMLVDRLDESAPALPDGFSTMSVIGLDATIVERGARTGSPGEAAPKVASIEGWRKRLFEPLHAPRYPV